jgi:hypothetical protein
MTFLKNLILFFVVYLPAVAIVSMLMELIPSVHARTPDTWDVGWNPIVWLLLSAPWQLPSVILVPLLHFLGWAFAARSSRSRARRAAVVASPILFLAAWLVLYGPENSNVESVVPVVLAGLLYGAVLRIPGARSAQSLP